MTAGLRTWDQNGNLLIDINSRIGTVVGFVDTGRSSGSITVPQWATSGVEPFYAIWNQDNGYLVLAPQISISGTTLSWSFLYNGIPANSQCRIIYGYY